MELLTKIVNGFQLLAIFAKILIFDGILNGPLNIFEESNVEWLIIICTFKVTGKFRIPQKIVSLDM